MRTKAKVGFIVFLGILVFCGIYWFLGGATLTRNTYPIYSDFDNVLKLDKGADVRIAGVKIGLIQSMSLTKDNRVKVRMLIENKYRVPIDSIARATTGGLIGDTYVEIVPGHSKTNCKVNGKIRSITATSFDQISDNVDTLLVKLQVTADSVNAVLKDKDIKNSIKDTMNNISSAAASASEMLETTEEIIKTARPDLLKTLQNVQMAADKAASVAVQMNDILEKDARPNFMIIMKQSQEVLTSLGQTIRSTNQIVDSLGGNTDRIAATLEKVDLAAAEAQEMMIKLNEASNGIKDLTTNKETQEDIKRTLKNTADAAESAKILIDALNKKLGLIKKTDNNKTPEPPENGLSINGLWKTDQGKYRMDASYTLPINKNFYRIGANDIGEGSKATIQGGRMLTSKTSIRYGLYSSKAGIGFDNKIGSNILLSADIYDPNDPNLEIRSVFDLGKDIGLYTGYSDVLDSDNRSLLLGLRYNK